MNFRIEEKEPIIKCTNGVITTENDAETLNLSATSTTDIQYELYKGIHAKMMETYLKYYTTSSNVGP